MEIQSRLVAIVDDDASVCRALSRVVRSLGFRTAVYASGEALLGEAAGMPLDHVLLDLHLPGLRGTDLLQALRSCSAATRVVVMTGLDRPGARQACLAAGAVAYILNPVQSVELERLLAASPPG